MGYITDEQLREAHPHIARYADSLRKVYVASSWRNPSQPEVVKALRAEGHQVYDFRDPVEGDNGFHWSEIDPDWRECDVHDDVAAWRNPDACRAGVNVDDEAACVMGAVLVIALGKDTE